MHSQSISASPSEQPVCSGWTVGDATSSRGPSKSDKCGKGEKNQVFLGLGRPGGKDPGGNISLSGCIY